MSDIRVTGAAYNKSAKAWTVTTGVGKVNVQVSGECALGGQPVMLCADTSDYILSQLDHDPDILNKIITAIYSSGDIKKWSKKYDKSFYRRNFT